ncbi:MAG: 2-succinyl-5-enolpyruvyl-6-hydroxy-3-cyclohexene-1-carboxylic-acid synthase [Salibacteraceae bacterium]
MVDSLWKIGLTHVVISPGSRNAPLIIGFSDHEKYNCFSVPDERTAGFIALGMAHQSQSPVALVCSSGSALLNYYPAIAEAFYRKVPLIILSADRPERLIDQGDGQTIRQKNVFANHILFSGQLEEDLNPENEKSVSQLKDALSKAIPSLTEKGGPIHFNLPFEEPLYGLEEVEYTDFIPSNTYGASPIPSLLLHEISEKWNSSIKIVILVGQKDPHPGFDEWLEKVGNHALILSETTSNLNCSNNIATIDRLITNLTPEEKEKFKFDLLLTFGGNIVSKRIKALIRSHPPMHHYHIEVTDLPPNTYQCLTAHLNTSLTQFGEAILPFLNLKNSSYVGFWKERNMGRISGHQLFAEQTPWSDFKVMSILNQKIPSGCIFHLANSTSVRYAQLFDWKQNLTFHANRGTSGIDGIVSTAMGTAIATSKPVFLIVGDISFFYDTNAWWHRHIPVNLKVIVVNNNGGGIFRFIDGPNNSGQLENHFETNQKNSVLHIAKGFEVNYFRANEEESLKSGLESMINTKASCILEVFTPQLENAEVLKNYFKSFTL